MSLLIENQNIPTYFVFNKITLKRLLELTNDCVDNIYSDIINFYIINKDEKNKYVLKVKYDEIFYHHINNLSQRLTKIHKMYLVKTYNNLENSSVLISLTKNYEELYVLYKTFFGSINTIIKYILNFCYIYNINPSEHNKNQYYYTLDDKFYEAFNYLYNNLINIELIDEYFNVLINNIN